MKKLPNGDLIFPIRGEPPKVCPEGYIKDPTDPWVCKPDVPCTHRVEVEVESCCTSSTSLQCNYFGSEINLSQCQKCEFRRV